MITTSTESTRPLRAEPDGLLRLGLFYPTLPFPHFLSSALHRHVPDILDLDAHRSLLATAEELGFDYMFMADTYATYGPLCKAAGFASPQFSATVLGTWAAACTTRMGIVTTMQLLYLHPVVLARMGANIDVISGGRWGMNMVSGASFAEGLLPEPARSLSHDERYALAEESMEIITTLWAGDPIEHHGKYFEVNGELIEPLPLQRPHPLLVSAGASPSGLSLAGKYAEVLFVPSAAGQERIDGIRSGLDRELVTRGRRPEDVKLQTNLVVIVRDSDDEAAELIAALRAEVDLPAAREYAASISAFSQTYNSVVGAKERTDDELRDLGIGQGVTVVSGSPETVARALIALHSEQGMRGLAINFPIWRPEELRRFGEGVMPLLEEAGVWSSPLRRGYSW